MQEEKCLFCKIVAGEIPNYKVYEDENFLAFLSIAPLNPGHTLIIPKKHYRWVWDMEDVGEYFNVVNKIAKAQKKAFNTEMIASAIIGEEIPHAHIWLVPRHENDGHKGALIFDNIKKLNEEEMKEAQERIIKELKN